jgi:predicted  nucleic acid-binding Zn-ribbon protein
MSFVSAVGTVPVRRLSFNGNDAPKNSAQSSLSRTGSESDLKGLAPVAATRDLTLQALRVTPAAVSHVNSRRGSLEIPHRESLSCGAAVDFQTPVKNDADGTPPESPSGDNGIESSDTLSPLPFESILKNKRRESTDSMCSIDSNAGLSPDIVALKYRAREMASRSEKLEESFQVASLEALRSASTILKAREEHHNADKLRLRGEIVNLHKSISDLTVEKSGLQQAIGNLEAKIADYEGRLQGLSVALTKGTKALESLQAKYTKTKAVLTQQANDLEASIAVQKKEQRELQVNIANLKSEKAFLEQTKLSEIERLEDQYKGKVAELDLEIENLRLAVDRLAQENLALKASLAEATEKQQKTADKNKTLGEENKALKSSTTKLRAALATAESQKITLEQQVAEQVVFIAKLQAMIEDPSAPYDVSSVPSSSKLGFAPTTITEDKHTAGQVRRLSERHDDIPFCDVDDQKEDQEEIRNSSDVDAPASILDLAEKRAQQAQEAKEASDARKAARAAKKAAATKAAATN